MGLLSFSNTKRGRYFSFSLTLFTVYTLTNLLRWLPVMQVQLPIIALCYVMLLMSCNQASSNRLLGLTLVLLAFDYIFIFLQGGMSSGSVQNAIGANYTIFVSFFPLLYVASGNFDLINRRKFLQFIYVLVFITALTTIYGTLHYETPCRELATPDNVEIDRLYKAQNIGGYGFIYFLVLFTPVVLKDLLAKKKLLLIVLLAVMAYCIFRAEYTTAMLLFIVAFALSFIVNSKNQVFRIFMIIAVVVFAISFESILEWASSSVFDYSFTMGRRLELISDYNEYGEATDDMGIRQYLYLLSLKAFLQNPLFGGLVSSESKLGGHSEILDYLGHSGFVGILVLLFLLNYIRKYTPVSRINFKDPFIKSVMIVALIMAAINTFLSPELYFAILIVPMLLNEDGQSTKQTIYG